MAKFTTKWVKITCGESSTCSYGGASESGETYTVNGHLLEDGRLLTYGTGVDGRDSLWVSEQDFTPNGNDSFISLELTGATGVVSDQELRSADTDNRKCLGITLASPFYAAKE